MRLNPYPRSELNPAWTAIVWAVSTVWANWIWANWFAQAKDVEIALLAMASLLGWPMMLAALAGVLGYTMERLQEHLWACAAIALCVLGAGLAIYGIPGPWNLIVSAIVAVYMGLQAQRTAQDDDALEDL